ncbi:MAG: protein translocase subunit SecF [Clostridiales bacterium]|nr:protein translocase subunit SecF [Clostridiales bacterium]
MFDIMKKKWIFFGIAIVLCLISIVSLIFQGFNLDTDFSGGIALTYEIGSDFTTSDIESIVSEALGTNKSASSVQKSGGDVIIKVGYDKDLSDDERIEYSATTKDTITTALEAKYGAAVADNAAATETTEAVEADAAVTASPDASATPAVETDTASSAALESGVRLKSMDDISPSSGQELARSAFWMSLLACAAILIYVTFRFEFTSGCVAIVALIHDVLLLLGVYSLFRWSVNINFIAAVLTVLGYSINNTIVIMDRIRENTRHSRKESYGEIANNSIWQTFTRSVNTTITTLLTIGMVYILGVASIKAFALPIIIGIVVGFYSSVFITGPLWATWKDSAVKAKKANGAAKAEAKKASKKK